MMKIMTYLKLARSKDPLDRFKLLRGIGKRLLPAYRFKWPQMGWWEDREFNDYLRLFDEIDGNNTDRRWMLHQLMRVVEDVAGDTAECGVYRGASSYVICRMNRANELHHRTHHMFDSFEGLSRPSDLDGSHWAEGDLSCDLGTVSENLSAFENVNLWRGWIPERFHEVENLRFCFAHIDVDLYQPTLDSLAFFYPRTNQGGVILCDDYGFTSCPGATTAVDLFLEDKKEKMISLSGGGGFLLKGTETARPLSTARSVPRKKHP